MTKEKQLPTADGRNGNDSSRGKNGKECKEQETENRDSAARTHIGRAANALKAQGMHRTTGHANPGKDHTTSQNNRHFHAKRGLRRLSLEQPSSLQRR